MIRYLEIVLISPLHDRLQNVALESGWQNLLETSGVPFGDLRDRRVIEQETD